jgi:hypothetical protein
MPSAGPIAQAVAHVNRFKGQRQRLKQDSTNSGVRILGVFSESLAVWTIKGSHAIGASDTRADKLPVAPGTLWHPAQVQATVFETAVGWAVTDADVVANFLERCGGRRYYETGGNCGFFVGNISGQPGRAHLNRLRNPL